MDTEKKPRPIVVNMGHGRYEQLDDAATAAVRELAERTGWSITETVNTMLRHGLAERAARQVRA